MIPLNKSSTLSSLTSALALHCPLCGSGKLRKKCIQWKQGSFSRCQGCGFLFQDPPPSQETSRAFYEKDYYAELQSLEERIRAARKPLYADVLRKLNSYKKTGRLLDVGAGFGDFMKAARSDGWETWGLEPSLEACEEARQDFGAKVICGTSDEAQFDKDFFDVITLWNVLDCLPDPGASIAKLSDWLRPGGCLFIRTPNAAIHLKLHQTYKTFGPLCQKIGWKKDPAVFLRSNFNAATLKRFLVKGGFKTHRITNGMPTSGDPYGVMKKPGLVTGLKAGFIWLARVSAVISGGRWFLGTNLLVFAKKNSESRNVDNSRARQHQARAIGMRIKIKTVCLHVLAWLGYLTGLPLWCRLFRKSPSATVLLYHSVTSGEPGEMSVSVDAFRKQMIFLKEQFDVVSAEQAACIASASVKQPSQFRAISNKKKVAITFDDGYEDNYTQAYPILRDLGLTATVFLLTGGGANRQTTHFGQAQQHYPEKLLSWAQIREMAEDTFAFGSHGESHSRLGTLATSDIQAEIFDSKTLIERECGKPVRLFSYPYGTKTDFDSRTVDLVREAGYDAAFSAIYGTIEATSDVYALRRINVEAGDSLFTLRAKLNGALSWLSLFHWAPLRAAIRGLDGIFLRMAPRRQSPFEPVLIASVDFPPHTDGVSTIAGELARRISARRPDISILGPSDKGDKQVDRQSHYHPVRVPGYEWGYARMLPFALAMIWTIMTKGIRRVYALNIAYGGVIAWLLSYPLKLKYVLFAYGYEFEKVRSAALVRKWYQAMYARAEKVICCSEEVRKRLLEFGVSADKAELLYPAVDLDRYMPGIVRNSFVQQHGLVGKRVILTVGRLVERKGHDQVLRTLPFLTAKYPDIVYCISGKGGFETRLKELVVELGLEKHVQFMGRVPDDELRDLYNLCEFFIMPSREIESNGHIEGFGIVFLEANAFGKPVIGGHSGGVSEAIQDGVSGLLADPNSPQDIAFKMETLLANPAYAKQLGQSGLERLRTRFHWDGYIRRAYVLLMGEELP